MFSLAEWAILPASFWKLFLVNDEIENPLSNTDIFKKSKLNPNYKLARQLRKGPENDTGMRFGKNLKNTEPIERDFLQESKRGKLTDDLVTKAGFQIS